MLCNFSCERNSMMCSHSNEAFQVITFQTVVDSGEGPRGPEPSPLFLDQTEAQRGKKIFLGDRPLPYLRVWMTVPTPTPTPLSQGLDLPLPKTCHLCRVIYYIFYLVFLGNKKLSHQVTRILNAFHVSPRSEQTHTWDTLLA